MKKIRSISLDAEILLSPSFEKPDAFADLIEDFLLNLPTFSPRRWGVVEPISLELSMQDIRHYLRSGESDIMWKRNASPKGWGKFEKRTNPLRGPQFANVYFDVSVENSNQVADLISYAKHLSEWAGVEYACCDSLTESYKSVAFVNGLAPFQTSIFVPTFKLMKCLPDILWSQIFGPAYVKLIGLEKLLSAPAYKVEQLGPEVVYVQLSESVFDMHDHYAAVDAVRCQVKQHLDDNIFFNPINPQDHVYRVPQFKFLD
ncbi:hypothetical protein D3C86_911210 [compost metagenome]|jgi:hypothetical protein